MRRGLLLASIGICVAVGGLPGSLNGCIRVALADWPEGAIKRLGTPKFGHPSGAHAVAFSPDGRFLVSGGKSDAHDSVTIHIRDAATGQLIRKLASNGQEVRSLAFSPDGSTLAAGGTDDRIWIWDIATWTVRRRIGERLDPAIQVRFGPDGKTLASCHEGREDPNDDHPVVLWDVATGKKVGELNGHSGLVDAFSFSRDGKTLALGGWDATVRVFNVATRTEVHRLEDKAGPLHGVAFSPDGKTLAALSSDATVRIWDPIEGQLLLKFDGSCGHNFGFPAGATTLTYAPGGTLLAVAMSRAAGGTCPIVLADASTGLRRGTLVGHHSWIADVAFSPDGNTLASAGDDGTVRCWETSSGLEQTPPIGHAGWIEAVAFSPDGRRLATGGADHLICIWDTETGKETMRFTGHESKVRTIAFSPDGAIFASGGSDHAVRIWKAADGRLLHLWTHTTGVSAVTFSPDGSILLAADLSGAIIAREVASGKIMGRLICDGEFGEPSGINSIAYDPRGTVIASAHFDSLIRLWRLEKPKPLRVIRHEGVPSVTFSPTGWLAAAGINGPVRLYDPATGKEVQKFQELEDDPQEYTSVSLSPNGKWLAAGGFDGKVRLWNAVSGTALRVFSHQAPVTSVAFSPDSSVLASGSEDCLTFLWKVP